MATNKLLQVYGTQLVFANHDGSFTGSPTTGANDIRANDGVTKTPVNINCSGVAAAAARQSAKTAQLYDTGTAWPIEWKLGACIESSGTPTAGGTFDFYWNSSPSATAGVGNAGGALGTDSAYSTAKSNQLMFMGSLVVDASATNIDTNIGSITMPNPYGSLIVINNTDAPMALDTDETHITLTPIIPDMQASA